MKKLYLIIAVILCLGIFTGCNATNSDSASTTSSPDESLEPLQPLSPPVQPIEFDSLDDAVDFIKNNDLSKYREEEQIKYSEMNSVIKEINCLPVISFPNNNESRVDDFKIISVTLFPTAKYEDIGIGYYFNYQGKNNRIIFYFFDSDCSSKIAHIETIDSYMAYRESHFGSKMPFEPSERKNIKYGGKNIEAIVRTDSINFVHNENIYVRVNTNDAQASLDMLENISVSYLSFR